MANGEASSVQGDVVPKGKRFLAAFIDLFLIPIGLGVLAGLILLAVPEPLRNLLLIAVNIGWLLFRDTVFAPGRKVVGLKLVSDSGSKVTLGQAFIRNIWLEIPVILIVGYIMEIVFIILKGHRLADTWAKTRVVNA